MKLFTNFSGNSFRDSNFVLRNKKTPNLSLILLPFSVISSSESVFFISNSDVKSILEPKKPGIAKSAIDHISKKEFSTGVPVRAILKRPFNALAAFEIKVVLDLIF